MDKKTLQEKEISKSRKIIEIINLWLDIIMWIVLVAVAYWYGKHTGGCTDINYACNICEQAYRNISIPILTP